LHSIPAKLPVLPGCLCDPNPPAWNELISHPRLIGTPHIGAQTVEAPEPRCPRYRRRSAGRSCQPTLALESRLKNFILRNIWENNMNQKLDVLSNSHRIDQSRPRQCVVGLGSASLHARGGTRTAVTCWHACRFGSRKIHLRRYGETCLEESSPRLNRWIPIRMMPASSYAPPTISRSRPEVPPKKWPSSPRSRPSLRSPGARP